MKILPFLIFFFLLLGVAGTLGFLAYEADAQTAQKQQTVLVLQDTARAANKKAGDLEQKLACRDESGLIETLQKSAVTVGFADKTGKLLDEAQGLSLEAGLYPKVIVDSVLQARFPQHFDYVIKHASLIYFLYPGYQLEQTYLENGKFVCKNCARLPSRWIASFHECDVVLQRKDKLVRPYTDNRPMFRGQ